MFILQNFDYLSKREVLLVNRVSKAETLLKFGFVSLFTLFFGIGNTFVCIKCESTKGYTVKSLSLFPATAGDTQNHYFCITFLNILPKIFKAHVRKVIHTKLFLYYIYYISVCLFKSGVLDHVCPSKSHGELLDNPCACTLGGLIHYL